MYLGSKLCRGYILIPAFLFLLGFKIFGENPDTTFIISYEKILLFWPDIFNNLQPANFKFGDTMDQLSILRTRKIKGIVLCIIKSL